MQLHGVTIDSRDFIPVVELSPTGKRRTVRRLVRNTPSYAAVDRASARALIEAMTYSDPVRVEAARKRQGELFPLLRSAVDFRR